MIEKPVNIPQEDAEWKPVCPFGKGIIYSNGNDRKIVTPGFSDFKYQVPEPTQQIKS